MKHAYVFVLVAFAMFVAWPSVVFSAQMEPATEKEPVPAVWMPTGNETKLMPSDKEDNISKTTNISSVPGYHGKIDNMELLSAGMPTTVTPAAQLLSTDDVNLVEMSRRAMHYLINNPLADHNDECRFDIELLKCPPSMGSGSRDPYITFGDTESRMDLAFMYMRDISGSAEGRQVELRIRKRIMGYLRDDGLSWLPPYALDCNIIDRTPCAIPWTTGFTIRSLVEQSIRDGDKSKLALAKKLVAGLKSLASWDTGRAFYPGGLGGWQNGKWMFTGCSDSYPCILSGIVPYIQATGDSNSLEFAQAFAEGMMSDLQTNLGGNKILADGLFAGYNCHLHMQAVLGIIEVGVLTHNARYIEWGRRAYEFMMTQGTDWGWFPESVGQPNSETCVTGNMVDIAWWLTQAGYTRYWDDIERFVRNYICQSQFSVTADYESIYRNIHKDQAAEAEQGIRQVRDFEGGFVARLSPNSLIFGEGKSMNMMGCCPPEAMRGIYIAWKNVVTETPTGVFVNLSFNRDTAQAHVVSYAPNIGRLSVITKVQRDFFLRPPSWTLRSQVKAYRNGREVTPAWKNDYVGFSAAKAGEELTIIYPVVQFQQTVNIYGKTFTYSWTGSTVTSVTPTAASLPLFAEPKR